MFLALDLNVENILWFLLFLTGNILWVWAVTAALTFHSKWVSRNREPIIPPPTETIPPEAGDPE